MSLHPYSPFKFKLLCLLQITLQAASAAGDKAKVVLKAPSVGTTGGANMIQTIFSDYAPSIMPVDEVSLKEPPRGLRTG